MVLIQIFSFAISCFFFQLLMGQEKPLTFDSRAIYVKEDRANFLKQESLIVVPMVDKSSYNQFNYGTCYAFAGSTLLSHACSLDLNKEVVIDPLDIILKSKNNNFGEGGASAEVMSYWSAESFHLIKCGGEEFPTFGYQDLIAYDSRRRKNLIEQLLITVSHFSDRERVKKIDVEFGCGVIANILGKMNDRKKFHDIVTLLNRENNKDSFFLQRYWSSLVFDPQTVLKEHFLRLVAEKGGFTIEDVLYPLGGICSLKTVKRPNKRMGYQSWLLESNEEKLSMVIDQLKQGHVLILGIDHGDNDHNVALTGYKKNYYQDPVTKEVFEEDMVEIKNSWGNVRTGWVYASSIIPNISNIYFLSDCPEDDASCRKIMDVDDIQSHFEVLLSYGRAGLWIVFEEHLNKYQNELLNSSFLDEIFNKALKNKFYNMCFNLLKQYASKMKFNYTRDLDIFAKNYLLFLIDTKEITDDFLIKSGQFNHLNNFLALHDEPNKKEVLFLAHQKIKDQQDVAVLSIETFKPFYLESKKSYFLDLMKDIVDKNPLATREELIAIGRKDDLWGEEYRVLNEELFKTIKNNHQLEFLLQKNNLQERAELIKRYPQDLINYLDFSLYLRLFISGDLPMLKRDYSEELKGATYKIFFSIIEDKKIDLENLNIYRSFSFSNEELNSLVKDLVKDISNHKELYATIKFLEEKLFLKIQPETMIFIGEHLDLTKFYFPLNDSQSKKYFLFGSAKKGLVENIQIIRRMSQYQLSEEEKKLIETGAKEKKI